MIVAGAVVAVLLTVAGGGLVTVAAWMAWGGPAGLTAAGVQLVAAGVLVGRMVAGEVV